MMHLIFLFVATFSAAFLATVPPGLLNMNAAKTSVEKGKNFGVVFSLGVCTIVIIQAYVAVLISKFLNNNPEIIGVLLKVALVIFAFFTVYFFLVARKSDLKKNKVVKISKRNSFYTGGLLASLNLLAIPYYSGLNAMWNASGWIQFMWQDTLVFVLAAGLGTFCVLYLYVFYFNKLEPKKNNFSKKSNYILSGLMGVLFVVTLFRIFNLEVG